MFSNEAHLSVNIPFYFFSFTPGKWVIYNRKPETVIKVFHQFLDIVTARKPAVHSLADRRVITEQHLPLDLFELFLTVCEDAIVQFKLEFPDDEEVDAHWNAVVVAITKLRYNTERNMGDELKSATKALANKLHLAPTFPRYYQGVFQSLSKLITQYLLGDVALGALLFQDPEACRFKNSETPPEKQLWISYLEKYKERVRANLREERIEVDVQRDFSGRKEFETLVNRGSFDVPISVSSLHQSIHLLIRKLTGSFPLIESRFLNLKAKYREWEQSTESNILVAAIEDMNQKEKYINEVKLVLSKLINIDLFNLNQLNSIHKKTVRIFNSGPDCFGDQRERITAMRADPKHSDHPRLLHYVTECQDFFVLIDYLIMQRMCTLSNLLYAMREFVTKSPHLVSFAKKPSYLEAPIPLKRAAVTRQDQPEASVEKLAHWIDGNNRESQGGTPTAHQKKKQQRCPPQNKLTGSSPTHSLVGPCASNRKREKKGMTAPQPPSLKGRVKAQARSLDRKPAALDRFLSGLEGQIAFADPASQVPLKHMVWYAHQLQVLHRAALSKIPPLHRLNLLNAAAGVTSKVLEQYFTSKLPPKTPLTHNLRVLHQSLWPERPLPTIVKELYLANHWTRYFHLERDRRNSISTHPTDTVPLLLRDFEQLAADPTSMQEDEVRRKITALALEIIPVLEEHLPSHKMTSSHAEASAAFPWPANLTKVADRGSALAARVEPHLATHPSYRGNKSQLYLRQAKASYTMLSSSIHLLNEAASPEDFAFWTTRILALIQEGTENALKALSYSATLDDTCEHEIGQLAAAMQMEIAIPEPLASLFKNLSHAARYPLHDLEGGAAATMINDVEALRLYPEISSGFEVIQPKYWKKPSEGVSFDGVVSQLNLLLKQMHALVSHWTFARLAGIQD